MSKELALNDRVGAYGYGLYQHEIDEYLASDDEWEALKVRQNFLVALNLYYNGR